MRKSVVSPEYDCSKIVLPRARVLSTKHQTKLRAQESQKGLKISKEQNFALLWPICFFVVANLRLIWNTFTGLNNALLAQN